MKCPYQKNVIIRDRNEMDVRITKIISTKFDECWKDGCPFYYQYYGKDCCVRCDNESTKKELTQRCKNASAMKLPSICNRKQTI